MDLGIVIYPDGSKARVKRTRSIYGWVTTFVLTDDQLPDMWNTK